MLLLTNAVNSKCGRLCAQIRGSGSNLGRRATFTFITHQGFKHPNTRIYVRLLGPCFKTGGLKPFCQHREPSNFLTSLSTNLSHKQNFVLLRARASRNKEEQKRVIIPLSGPTHRNPVARRLPKKLSTTDLTDADQPTQQDPST